MQRARGRSMITGMRTRVLFALTVWFAASPAFAVGKKKQPALPAPAPTPPSVTVEIVASEPATGWSMRLTNTGLEAVRVVADARLLSLEITPPGGGPVARCVLPAEMRPVTDTGRTIVLVAGRSYSESFDPRLYCFAERERVALVAGAAVVGRVGFGADSPSPPFVAALAAPLRPELHATELVSAPVTVGAASPVVASPPASAPVSDAVPAALSVSMPARIDASAAGDTEIAFSVDNAGPRPSSLLLRSATLGLLVERPDGVTLRCGGNGSRLTAIAEAATVISPGGRASRSVNASALCPDVFDAPGLYVVRPRVDTRGVVGRASGFVGELLGAASFVRVRQGRGDLRPRPAPDPVPSP